MRLSDEDDETRDHGQASSDLRMGRSPGLFWRDLAASWGVVILLLVGVGVAVSLDHSVKIGESTPTWHVPLPLDTHGRPSERSTTPDRDEQLE